MGFQPINFATIAPQGNEFMRNFVDTLSKGYQAGQMPAKLEREARDKEAEIKQREIERAFKEELLKEQPQKFASENEARGFQNQLAKSRMDALKQKSQLPFGGNVAPGSVGQAMWVDMIGDKYGRNSEQYLRAKQAYESDVAKIEILNKYRNSKYALGAGGKDINVPTTANVTANQNVIQAIDNTLPGIAELKTLSVPREVMGMSFDPDASAKYNATVGGITDALVSALKLPKTNESISLVKSLVGRHPLESDASYKKRLTGLEKDLKQRKKNASQILTTKNAGGNSDLEPEATKVLNGKTYHLVDGEWVY